AGAEPLADAEFVPAGTLIRIRTTGGGGWGDPLDRPADSVVRDVAHGKVSVDGAARDYGVMIELVGDQPVADSKGTVYLRKTMRSERPPREPFFDRGPGYPRLSGTASAEVDWL
ncbi:MAG TPA: hydantoinase B/oxoprolinase family protein, partial [Streptosporangiaceae bacterium]|nr:hydantoinase B/oxoprolinase family protein [Streptosporangiaceae bacterium]